MAKPRSMIVALLTLTVCVQDQDKLSVQLPPGASSTVHSMVDMIEKSSAKGDWSEAARLADRLPGFELSIYWDDSKVDKGRKAAFKSALESAVGKWSEAIEELTVTYAKNALLKFNFVDTLPPNLDSPGPAAAVLLPSPAEDDPVLEVVLALNRGTDKVSTEELDVFNEVMYAIGSWFGLSRQPKPGSAMYRAEAPTFLPNRVVMSDFRLAKRISEVSGQIRENVSAKKLIKIVSPKIFIDPKTLRPTPVGQGEEMPVSLQITNRGTALLEFSILPDCSCFMIGPHSRSIEPGGTVIVPMYINTVNFVGKLNKALFVYSNDPDMPVRRIPMETTVRPAYRFVSLNEGSAVIIDENGGKYETILVLDADIVVTSVSVAGISAFATYEKWEGELDFPEIGEGKMMRKGIKISTLIAPDIATGRATMQIQVVTRSELFKTIYHSVVVQRGIVPVPMSIYFGEIEQGTDRAHTILSRPDKPFKVLSVESDTTFIHASVEPFKGSTNYKIVAQYDGTGPYGRFFAKITVKTDDPKQPVIVIPVEGIIS